MEFGTGELDLLGGAPIPGLTRFDEHTGGVATGDASGEQSVERHGAASIHGDDARQPDGKQVVEVRCVPTQ